MQKKIHFKLLSTLVVFSLLITFLPVTALAGSSEDDSDCSNENPFLISDCEDYIYCLDRNIDCSAKVGWNLSAGFVPMNSKTR